MKESLHFSERDQTGESSPGTTGGGDGGLFARLADHAESYAFILTFLAAFGVYLLSLPPHITLGNAGTHVTGAWYGGVGHPPGYPVWTLYACIFSSLVPVGNVAWRVALSSAFAAAVASGLIAAASCRMGRHLFEENPALNRLPKLDRQRLIILCSFAATCGFAFSSYAAGRVVGGQNPLKT